jgi:hypothetical protein
VAEVTPEGQASRAAVQNRPGQRVDQKRVAPIPTVRWQNDGLLSSLRHAQSTTACGGSSIQATPTDRLYFERLDALAPSFLRDAVVEFSVPLKTNAETLGVTCRSNADRRG